MKKTAIFIAASLAVAATLALGFAKSRNGLEIAKVVRGTAITAVYATGTVEPVEQAEIASDRTRRVVMYFKDEGAAVSKGEKLVQLEDEAEKANLDSTTARVKFLKSELERKQKLLKDGYATRREVEDLNRDLDENLAKADSLQHEIDRLALTSPLDGIILRREVEPGEIADPGKGIIWVGKPFPKRISAEVDEEDIGIVQTGQNVLIKADAFPDSTLEGKISEITPKGDSVNKVFRARISLPDETPLKVGMTTEVNIIAEKDDNALIIPSSSVSNSMVWKKEGRGFVKTPVKTSPAQENTLKLISGLNEGDEVLKNFQQKK